MTKINVAQTIIFAAFLMLLSFNTLAQDSYLKNRWNFKLSGAPELRINGRFYPAFLMAEANYGILNNIEVGVALGFENTLVAKSKPNPTHPMDFATDYYLSPLYNLHLNYHLLPYLVKEKNPRFDVYLIGKLGGAYVESDFSDQNFFWNYYLGGGLSWYFTRNIGVYTEYGKYWPFEGKTNKKTGFRFGVAVKL